MDGLVQVLVLSLFTALARSEGCSMVQDFSVDVIFNQSIELPAPLKQVNVKNSKICNSKCCSSDGCNVAYFDSFKSSNYSCHLYSCHPLSACGFLSQEGVQVYVNEADLPASSPDIVTPSVTTSIEDKPETDQIPTTTTVNYETPLPKINTNETANTSQPSIEIPATTSEVSNDTTSGSYETDTNEPTDTLQSSIQISTLNTTAVSNVATSGSYETDTNATTNTVQSSIQISNLTTTTVSNIVISESSETEAGGTGKVSPTLLQISTPIATENYTSAFHNDTDGLVSTFGPSSSSALVNQVIPTQTLAPSLSENFTNSISMPNLEESLTTTNNQYIQPSKSIDQIASQKVNFTLSSSNASSTQTSQNAASLQSSLVSALPSTTTVPNANGTETHNNNNNIPVLATSTVMLGSSKGLIASSNGSNDQIQPTSSTTYQTTSDYLADEIISALSNLLNLDVSNNTGNVSTLEGSVKIAPTTSGNVVTSASLVVEGASVNGTEASASMSGMPNVLKTLLLCSLAFGCIFILAVVGVLGKLVFDSYRKRHYSRLDYLINGMY